MSGRRLNFNMMPFHLISATLLMSSCGGLVTEETGDKKRLSIPLGMSEQALTNVTNVLETKFSVECDGQSPIAVDYGVSVVELDYGATGCLAKLQGIKIDGKEFSEDPTQPFNTWAINDAAMFLSTSETDNDSLAVVVTKQLPDPIADGASADYAYVESDNLEDILAGTIDDFGLNIVGQDAPELTINSVRLKKTAGVFKVTFSCAGTYDATAGTCSGTNMNTFLVVLKPLKDLGTGSHSDFLTALSTAPAVSALSPIKPKGAPHPSSLEITVPRTDTTSDANYRLIMGEPGSQSYVYMTVTLTNP